jgi:hypothetical protein
MRRNQFKIDRMTAAFDEAARICECPICAGRFRFGDGIREDRPEYASSWQPLKYCSAT